MTLVCKYKSIEGATVGLLYLHSPAVRVTHIKVVLLTLGKGNLAGLLAHSSSEQLLLSYGFCA